MVSYFWTCTESKQVPIRNIKLSLWLSEVNKSDLKSVNFKCSLSTDYWFSGLLIVRSVPVLFILYYQDFVLAIQIVWSKVDNVGEEIKFRVWRLAGKRFIAIRGHIVDECALLTNQNSPNNQQPELRSTHFPIRCGHQMRLTYSMKLKAVFLG